VHYIPNISAINISHGNKSFLYFNKEISFNDKNFNYNITPFLKYHEIKSFTTNISDDSKLFENYNFFNHTIIHITNNSITRYKPTQRLKADYLILSKNVNISITKLKEYFDFKEILFDSSNSMYKTQQ